MKKKILSTSLKLIPSSIQYKAFTKALNYLFSGQSNFFRFAGLVVSFKLTDVRRVWTFSCDGREFTQYKSKKNKADVICLMRSEVALALYSKQGLMYALKRGDIELVGSSSHIDDVNALLYGLESGRVDSLVDRLRAFLRLNPIDREQQVIKSRLSERAASLGIDLETVTSDQVQTQDVVDLVRDAALAIEKSDVEEALRLMSMAQHGRPSGPLICRKVDEYKVLLAR